MSDLLPRSPLTDPVLITQLPRRRWGNAAFDRPLDHLAAVPRDREIAADRQRPASLITDQPSGVLGIGVLGQIGECHVGPLLGERDAYRPADTGVAAGDQGDPVGEQIATDIAGHLVVRTRTHGTGFARGLLLLCGRSGHGTELPQRGRPTPGTATPFGCMAAADRREIRRRGRSHVCLIVAVGRCHSTLIGPSALPDVGDAMNVRSSRSTRSGATSIGPPGDRHEEIQ
ncbi:hypothetical protein PA7_14170 [Pseudonocardia asaccharolytica DSM 44247 = NBRC 16224]|uniref:Uncharacterized protein n=1 Tax=Pseudonocardia asaccharolytica DSM 44247 = NBRC 16224 TaxID=1123024 RepID=A0A511CYE9_9PSEU|nr:hypothetical protein PA7_14170 [Pseudonocardia asaccharolytica DSM 44247 = NBRC 16224]